MGYSYDSATGELCCDVCDRHGGVIKFRCPFGWCQAIALCPECRSRRPELVSATTHRNAGCERNHQLFTEREDQRKAKISFGEFIRCSALWHPKRPGLNVKVIFEGNEAAQAYWMSQETYHKIGLDFNATPDDYRKHGEVVDATSLDIYDAEMDEVKV